MAPEQALGAVARLAGLMVALALAPATAKANIGWMLSDNKQAWELLADVASSKRGVGGGGKGAEVDPFTGSLRIVQEDLVLPGKAGLDLRIVRTYSSAIWTRSDKVPSQDPGPSTPSPEILPAPEYSKSVVGYGWDFHMGRLYGTMKSGAGDYPTACSNDYPVYEAPDGSRQIFFPTSTNNFVSEQYWHLQASCAQANGGFCVWTDTGTLITFDESGGASRIVDPSGNTITIRRYGVSSPLRGEIQRITDSLGREVFFEYELDPSVRPLLHQYKSARLKTIQVGVNGPKYLYGYDVVPAGSTGVQALGTGHQMIESSRPFLTSFTDPVGRVVRYGYRTTATVAQNQYALDTITHPGGALESFEFQTAPYFDGLEQYPRPVVYRRTSKIPRAVRGADGDQGLVTEAWWYEFRFPTLTCEADGSCSVQPDGEYADTTDFNVTKVHRPDGRLDTYVMVGLGWVSRQQREAKSFVMNVGSMLEAAIGDRAEVTTYYWAPIATQLSSKGLFSYLKDGTNPVNGSPTVQSVCSVNTSVQALWRKIVSRDGMELVTEWGDFDEFGQALSMREDSVVGGYGSFPPLQTRLTTWEYTRYLADHIVHGRPRSKKVCVDGDCELDGWDYFEGNAPAHLLQHETKSGITTSYEYDGSGQVKTVHNARGEWLTILEYQYGIPSRIDFNGAYQVSRTISPFGWVLDETDGRGNRTSTEYDAIGRPKRITPPGAIFPAAESTSWTDITYAPDDSWQRKERGTFWEQTVLDGYGRATKTTDREGTITTKQYDYMGILVFKSYPWNSSTGEVGEQISSLDGLGRPLEILKAYRPAEDVQAACLEEGACRVTLAYNYGCEEVLTQRGPGDFDSFQGSCFWPFGSPGDRQLRQVQDGAGSVWSYHYRANGKLDAVAAPLQPGNRTLNFDRFGFAREEVTAESGTVTFQRDAIGQVLVRTDARGVQARYGRDDRLGRVTSIVYDDVAESKVGLSYDNSSNLVGIESTEAGKKTFAWDELNRPASVAWTYGDITYTTGYQYDSMGCPKRITYPTGLVVDQTCDSAGRVTGVLVSGNASYKAVERVDYRPTGQPTLVKQGNGVDTSYEHDDAGRTRVITNRVGTGEPLLHWVYSYDGANNVKSVENKKALGSGRTMTYDAADRLESATSDSRWGVFTYGYDALGNRTSKDLVKGQAHTWMTYSYDEHNRLTAAAGLEEVRSQRFTWSRAGTLASSTDVATGATTRYRYDGQGKRVAKEEPGATTLYHYDAAGRLISETDEYGVKLRDYVYLGNQLAVVDGCTRSAQAGCVEWYQTDALGSVVARTNGAGEVVAQLDYQPWGELWAAGPAGADPGDRQYNGRVFDQESGFHDYGARMYWPQIGRFISADDVMGEPGNPASLNRYSYVWNNPYKFNDPDGHQAIRPSRLVNPMTEPPIQARVLMIRQAIAVGRIQARGGSADTIRAPGAPSEAAVRHMERLANSVDPPSEIINPATGLPVGASPLRFTPEQQALIEMAKRDKSAGGVTLEDMEAYKELNAEAGPSGFVAKGAVRGPEVHPPRTPQSAPGPGQEPHGHVGPVNHIPVKPGT